MSMPLREVLPNTGMMSAKPVNHLNGPVGEPLSSGPIIIPSSDITTNKIVNIPQCLLENGGLVLDPQFAPLFNWLQGEEFSQQLLEKISAGFSREIKLLKSDEELPKDLGRCRPISQEKFYELYDKTVPTLGLVITPGNGGALLALAASQLKAIGKSVMNIVFIPNGMPDNLDFALEDNGKWGLQVRKGILIDKDGSIYGGQFPQPVKVDLIDVTPTEENLLRKCEELNIPTVNPKYVFEIERNKVTSKELFKSCGVMTPRGIDFNQNDFADPDKVKAKIRDFVSQSSTGYVVKPVSEGGGMGVTIIEPNNETKAIDLIYDAAKQVVEKYGTAMVEERIRSYPIVDKKGNRMDWIIRHFATKTGVIDWEAWVRPHESRELQKPVNGNVDAEIQEVDYVFDEMDQEKPNHPNLFQDIRNRIDSDALKIARELGDGIFGFDFIIDEHGNPICLEVQASPGGIDDLVEHHTTLEGKLAPLEKLLTHLALQVPPKGKSNSIPLETCPHDFWFPINSSSLLHLTAYVTQCSKEKTNAQQRLYIIEKLLARFEQGFPPKHTEWVLNFLNHGYQQFGLDEDSRRIIKRLEELKPTKV